MRFFRWLLILFALFSLSVIMLIAYSAYKATQVPASSVLRVSLDGSLPEAAHPSLTALLGGTSRITTRGLTEAIRRAATDDRIVGLVLDIGEPHLGVAQIAEIEDAMAVFRDTDKESVAFLETAGELGHGDGAFALAVTADRVVLAPPGEVSLSGLHAEVPFFKETLSRLHVQPLVAQRYEYKNFANTFNQDHFTAEHREALKAVLDDVQRELLEHIAQRREVDAPVVRSWAARGSLTSTEALAQHLVDNVQYWDEVLSDARKWAKRDDPFIEVDSYKARTDLAGHGGTKVAFITGSGEISRGDTSRPPIGPSEGIGADTLAQAFRAAREAKVKAVLFRIDSPGGSYIASDVIRREVELTRKDNIPVVVSMGSVAASGGYFIAIDADYIVAEPSTITGSIGVVAVTFAMRQALHDWLGITFDSYDTLPHTAAINWLDLPDAAGKELLERSLDRIYKDFVGKVAVARHKSYDDIHAVARGRIWSGKQAKEHGLVDALGGMETAVGYIRERLKLPKNAALDLQIFPEPETALVMLRKMLSGAEAHAYPTAAALRETVRQLATGGMELMSPWANVDVRP